MCVSQTSLKHDFVSFQDASPDQTAPQSRWEGVWNRQGTCRKHQQGKALLLVLKRKAFFFVSSSLFVWFLIKVGCLKKVVFNWFFVDFCFVLAGFQHTQPLDWHLPVSAHHSENHPVLGREGPKGKTLPTFFSVVTRVIKIKKESNWIN